jgi:hypothetical protein
MGSSSGVVLTAAGPEWVAGNYSIRNCLKLQTNIPIKMTHRTIIHVNYILKTLTYRDSLKPIA